MSYCGIGIGTGTGILGESEEG